MYISTDMGFLTIFRVESKFIMFLEYNEAVICKDQVKKFQVK